MDDSQNQLLASLRDSANVLVTVTANPSVDQLAGAIGLTLLLNKLGKHATAIFSGRAPEVMEFLKPEATLEKNTDSLRDFIIALDKSKADKLRYKVEDTMVKIFITPYHTALSEKDLQFSLGDYNVDLVVALGAHAQQDLDQAIVSHGQILHDAVISSINNHAAGTLGTINWVDAKASSLCEMIFDLCQQLQPDSLDPQMATALLTGIVSETRRFGNDKTTAKSLETSSLLVAAGANQQLVAAKLEEKPAPIPQLKARPAAAPQAAPQQEITATDTHKDPEAVPQTDGTVTINHDDESPASPGDIADIHIDDQGQLHAEDELPAPTVTAAPTEVESPAPTGSRVEGGSKLLVDRPSLPGNDTFMPPSDSGPTVDPLSNDIAANPMPLLSHDSGPARQPSAKPLSSQPDDTAGQTLSQIENSVASPHTDVQAARDAVNTVASATPDLLPKPTQALNAQPIHLDEPTPEPPKADTQSPPPVPPPMMPNFTMTNPSSNPNDTAL